MTIGAMIRSGTLPRKVAGPFDDVSAAVQKAAADIEGNVKAEVGGQLAAVVAVVGLFAVVGVLAVREKKGAR